MKLKKGFTLIEIIVCIVLISVIGTVVIVNIQKNKDKPEEKVIDTVKNASTTYLAVRNNLIEDMKDNEGYLVLKIQELIDMGYLDEKILYKIDLSLDGYDKVILKKRDIINIEDVYKKGGEYEDIGLYDVIYPYIENEYPYLIFKEPLIFYNNDDYESTLSDECKKIQKFYLFDKDYDKKEVDSSDYTCNDEFIEIDGIIKYIKYTYNKYTGYRKVVGCGKRAIKYLYEGKNEEYTGGWTNNNIIVKSELNDGAEDNTNECDGYFQLKVNNGIEDLSDNKINTSGNYTAKLYFDSSSKKFEEESNIATKTQNIKIDKNSPEIENITMVGDDYQVKIKDNESGINEIKIGDAVINTNTCTNKLIDGGYKNCTVNINSNDKNKEILIKDSAGNELNTIDFSTVKSFSYSVIDSTKFNVLLTGFTDNNFKLNYKYDGTNYVTLEYEVENNERKIEKEIDLFDILDKCKENNSCKSKLVSNEIFIQKNSLDLQIEIGDMTFDFTITLNIYFGKNLFGDSGYGYKFYILGVNDLGNILYNKYIYNDGTARNEYYLFANYTTNFMDSFWKKSNSSYGGGTCGKGMISLNKLLDEKITFIFNNDNVISNTLSFSYWEMKKCTYNDTLSITTKTYNIRDKSSNSISNTNTKGHQNVLELREIYNSYTDDIMNKASNFVDNVITDKKKKIIYFWNNIKRKDDYYMTSPNVIGDVKGIDNYVYKDNSINYSFVGYCEKSRCSTSKKSAYIKIIYFNDLEIRKKN